MTAYIKKAETLNIKVQTLEDVVDVDTMLDVYHNASLLIANEYCYKTKTLSCFAYRTLEALRYLQLADYRVLPNKLGDPREEVDNA